MQVQNAVSRRLELWSSATEWPLMTASIAFLAAYAWPILDPQLPAGARLLYELVTWATWALFAIDYVVRVAIAPYRRRYVARHLGDLGVIALPLLRPLRLLRLPP